MILLHVLLLILRHRNGSLSPAGSMHTQSLEHGAGRAGRFVLRPMSSLVLNLTLETNRKAPNHSP